MTQDKIIILAYLAGIPVAAVLVFRMITIDRVIELVKKGDMVEARFTAMFQPFILGLSWPAILIMMAIMLAILHGPYIGWSLARAVDWLIRPLADRLIRRIVNG